MDNPVKSEYTTQDETGSVPTVNSEAQVPTKPIESDIPTSVAGDTTRLGMSQGMNSFNNFPQFDSTANSPVMAYHYGSFAMNSITPNNGGISPATGTFAGSFGLPGMYNGHNFTYGRMNSNNSRFMNDSPAGFPNRYVGGGSLGGIAEPRSDGADKDLVYHSQYQQTALTTPTMAAGSNMSDSAFQVRQNLHDVQRGWNLESVPEATPFYSASPEHVSETRDHSDEDLETPNHAINPDNQVGSGGFCSVGSTGHPNQCRPCAFFWTKGCMNGKDCRFCHEWHPPKKKKPMKEQKNLMIIARPDGRIEFMRCTVQEALGVL